MQRVTKEIAVLLKACGYDRPVFSYIYEGDTGTNCDRHEITSTAENMNAYDMCYSKPTIHATLDWLREEHGIHICIDCTLDWHKWFITLHDKQEKMWSKGHGSHDTHATALSAGIETALLIVKERMK